MILDDDIAAPAKAGFTHIDALHKAVAIRRSGSARLVRQIPVA
jgi:hypothetical protein